MQKCIMFLLLHVISVPCFRHCCAYNVTLKMLLLVYV